MDKSITVERVEYLNEAEKLRRKIKIFLSNQHVVCAEIARREGKTSFVYYGANKDLHVALTMIELHENWLMGGERPL